MKNGDWEAVVGAGHARPLQFLEELVEGVAGVFGIAGRGGAYFERHRRRHVVGAFAGHRHARHERIALVGLVLHGDAHQDGLEALEARGWLEVGTLLATVQLGVAFGAVASEVDVWRKGCRAIETSGGGDMLDQARQAGAGDVDGRTRPERFGPVGTEASGIAVRIHVPWLSVLAIAVHGEGCSVTSGTKERSFEKPALYTDQSPRGRAALPTAAVRVGLPEGFCGNAGAPDTNRSAAPQSFKYICTTD